MFLNARTILNVIDRLKIRPTIIIGSAAVAFIILLYWFDLTTEYTSKWLGLASAIIVFTILKKIFNNAGNNLLVDSISAISFEIYLIHHVFCFGKYSIYQIIPNPILGTIVILLISIILAYILNAISKYINRNDCIFKKSNR